MDDRREKRKKKETEEERVVDLCVAMLSTSAKLYDFVAQVTNWKPKVILRLFFFFFFSFFFCTASNALLSGSGHLPIDFEP